MLPTIEHIIFEKTPHQVMYEKLMSDEPIDRSDIQALGMFNDYWIDKLMSAGQATIRAKMVEALSREGIEVIE